MQMRGIALAAVALGCLLACSLPSRVPAAPGGQAETAPPSVTLGDPRVLLASGALGLDYFPDGPALVVEAAPALRLLMAVGVSSYRIEGPDIEHLAKAQKVLGPGPAGSFDNGYAGIGGVCRCSDGSLFAVYHAEDQEGMPPIPGGIAGFYCRVGAAVSADGGGSWGKLGPIVTSAKEKEWFTYPGQADRGAGEPALVKEKSGRYLYVYYAEHSRQGGRGVQTCMARAPFDGRPPAAESWRKYHEGRFAEAASGGQDTPVLSVQHLDMADALFPSVTYSEELGQYLMVLNVNAWKELQGGPPQRSGIYLASSRDGIAWSEPRQLFADFAVVQVGKPVSWHPSILWDAGSTREGWLLYSHSDKWGHRGDSGGTPHHLVGRRIRLSSGTEK